MVALKRQYLMGVFMKPLLVLGLTSEYTTVVCSMEPASTNESRVTDSDMIAQQNRLYQESVSIDIEKGFLKIQKAFQEEKSKGILQKLISLNNEIGQLEIELQNHNAYLKQFGDGNPKIAEKIEKANVRIHELLQKRADFLNLNNSVLTSFVNDMLLNLDRLMKSAKENNCDIKNLDAYLKLKSELEQVAKYLPSVESVQEVKLEENPDDSDDISLDDIYLDDVYEKIGKDVSRKICSIPYCRENKNIVVPSKYLSLINEFFGEVDFIERDYFNYINFIESSIEETMLSEIKQQGESLNLYNNSAGNQDISSVILNCALALLGSDRDEVERRISSKITKLVTLMDSDEFRNKILKSYLEKYISHKKNKESKSIILKQETGIKLSPVCSTFSLVNLLSEGFLGTNCFVSADLDPLIFEHLDFKAYTNLLQLNKTFCSSFSSLNQFDFGSKLLHDYAKCSIPFPLEMLKNKKIQRQEKHHQDVESYNTSYWGIKTWAPSLFKPDDKEFAFDIRMMDYDINEEEKRVKELNFHSASVNLLKKAADHIHADCEAIASYINHLASQEKYTETIEYFNKIFEIQDELTINAHLDLIDKKCRQKAFSLYFADKQNVPSWKMILLGENILKGQRFLSAEDQKIRDAIGIIRFGEEVYKPEETCSIM